MKSMKRILALIFALSLALLPNASHIISAATSETTFTAQPTPSQVTVNGKDTPFDAYLINGNNYFKLRDLAYVLSGTEKQFNVDWDEANNAIILTSGKPYKIVGGEMAAPGTANKTAAPTSSKIYSDGKEVQFTAYNIGGNNYFKLRDIMKSFDVYVGYDDATRAITLDTNRSYYAPMDLAIPVNYAGLPNKLTRVDKSQVDSLAFYVGQVARAYGSESKLEAVANLGDFITDTAVTSFNKELTLNYNDGFLTIDTDKIQGVAGFMENAQTELSDVKIDCGNEYASIMVASLDDTALKNSGKILIQSMTEEKIYGFTTEPAVRNNRDVEVITSVGGGMMQVREIKATVTLKGITGGYAAVLDENGYVKRLLDIVETEGNSIIEIPKDAVYVAYSAEVLAIKDLSGAGSAFIWWEGERLLNGVWNGHETVGGIPNPNFVDSNFPKQSAFDIERYGQVGNVAFAPDNPSDFSGLSEGAWLSVCTELYIDDQPAFARYNPDETVFAKYTVKAEEDGLYSFYARVFWNHGPFRWRFDDGVWTQRTGAESLLDSYTIRTWLGANWIYLGEVGLTAGTHTFELQMTSPAQLDDGKVGYVGAFDCFLLTKEPFVADGKVKPGDSKPDPEKDFFAFDPGYDNFDDDAVMDLRWLNEDYAGQNGFIISKDGKFYSENKPGEEVRFWAVNTGHGVLNSGRNAIDTMAKILAKRGVNMIRLHGATFTLDANRRAVVDSELLDNIHYFVKAMKDAGIYTKLSVYFPLWHNFGSSTGYPAYDGINNKNPFALLQFDRDFQNAYMDGVRKLLEPVNPYTGAALKDEPAIAIFEIQNEDNYFFWTFSNDNIPDAYMRDLEKQFGDWLTAKYGSINEASRSWGSANLKRDDFENGIAGLQPASNMSGSGKRISDQREFLTYSQAGFYAMMTAFIKAEVGAHALTLASNWVTANPEKLEALERYTYMATDITSRNSYYGPAIDGSTDGQNGYAVNAGHWFVSQSGLKNPDGMPFRKINNYGMPSIITEINYTTPNYYRAEFPILLSAYSALQGINAPISFSLGLSWEQTIGKFSIFTPAVAGQFPAAALMYRLGYVSETGPIVLETLNVNDLYNGKGSFVNEHFNLDVNRQP